MKDMKKTLKTLILTIFIIPIGIIAQNQSILFDSTWYGSNIGPYENSRYPRASKLVDIDNDGDSDIVMALWPHGRGFAIKKNNGSGFFTDPTNFYITAKAPLDIFAADLNNDGYKDIIIPNSGDVFFPPPGYGTSVSVYFNQGNGGFLPPVNITTGLNPVGVVTSDFDNDNDIDIAVANYGHIGQGNTVSIITNNGNGTFQPAVDFPAGNSPYKLAAAKINGDNLIDLVIANDNNTLNVLINSSGNNFINRTEYIIPLTPASNKIFPSVCLVDIDNDNDNDILYSNVRAINAQEEGVIVIIRNLGNGTFSSHELIGNIEYNGQGRVDIEAADLNNDGWKDIISAIEGGAKAAGYVVSLNSSGNFTDNRFFTMGQFTNDMMIGDIDKDGKTDISAIDRGTLQVMVQRNHGSGVLPNRNFYPTADLTAYLDAADIDHDGDLDLISSGGGFTAVSVPVGVMKNNGNGVFSQNILYTACLGGISAKFKDLNNDSFPDIYFATGRNNQGCNGYNIHTALNLGDGTFGPRTTWTMNGCGWFEMDAADMNNDNYNDLIVTEPLGCAGVPLSARRIFISLNLGNGSFASPIIVVTEPSPMPLVTGDFNRDGKMDIITGHVNSVAVHLGLGNGNVQLPATVYTIGQDATDIATADFNNDNKLDIATSDANNPTPGMSVLLGNGDGTFQAPQNYPGAYADNMNNGMAMTSGDVDRDGDIDVIVGNSTSNDFAVYLNNNNGTSFSSMLRYGSTYPGCFGPCFADFNNDSIGDIAFTAWTSFHPLQLNTAVVIINGINTNTVGIETGNESARKFLLMQNYPNPFNPKTKIRFSIPALRDQHIEPVQLIIYDITGKEVETLINEELNPGNYEVYWDASGFSSGVYFYMMNTEGFTDVKKMVLVK